MANFKITNSTSLEKASHKSGNKKRLFTGGRKLNSTVSFSTGFTVLFFIAAIIFAEVSYIYIHNKTQVGLSGNSQIPSPSTVTVNSSTTAELKPPPVAAAASSPEEIASLNLPIPFTSQAPTANWDYLHNEACEEASAIMANAYLTGDKDEVIPSARVETEISGLTVWQDSAFGYHFDTTAEETAQMIRGFYGLKATVQTGYTLQDIKDQLNLHHVVILPVNGRLINNPNYKKPGPIYHMLVIRGYNAAGLITNDAGTRNGKNYPYTFNTLYSAGADWDHSINSIDQAKIIIIVSK